ncbi:hypothetical protein [Nocardioides sp. InS609-2]|uniref:hypothetical protein n=1 Tax=Nocardioides sp. InS609-2 TaxID=2760705 RepID=UPI0020BF0270|nr:hypothetical protein [Nocardioides sp. InS609-2]
MSRPNHRVAALAVASVLAAGLAGCADDTPTTSETWPAVDDLVDTSGLVWAVDGVVHLGDGSTIDTGSTVTEYVVAGDGVWFRPDTPDDDGLAELRHATSSGVEGTRAHPHPSTLSTSPDGRFLAFLDRPQGADGPAEAVVVDLADGTELVRSRTGLGKDVDDWADLYEEVPISVIGVSVDTAYVQAVDGVLAYDLATGQGSPAEVAQGGLSETDWYQQFSPTYPLPNVAGTWAIRNPDDLAAPPELVPADGDPVSTRLLPADGPPVPGGPALERWWLDSWLDDATTVGGTPAGTEQMPSSPLDVLITCTVPAGTCRPIPGTERGALVPGDRDGDALLVR